MTREAQLKVLQSTMMNYDKLIPLSHQSLNMFYSCLVKHGLNVSS